MNKWTYLAPTSWHSGVALPFLIFLVQHWPDGDTKATSSLHLPYSFRFDHQVALQTTLHRRFRHFLENSTKSCYRSRFDRLRWQIRRESWTVTVGLTLSVALEICINTGVVLRNTFIWAFRLISRRLWDSLNAWCSTLNIMWQEVKSRRHDEDDVHPEGSSTRSAPFRSTRHALAVSFGSGLLGSILSRHSEAHAHHTSGQKGRSTRSLWKTHPTFVHWVAAVTWSLSAVVTIFFLTQDGRTLLKFFALHENKKMDSAGSLMTRWSIRKANALTPAGSLDLKSSKPPHFKFSFKTQREGLW